MKIGKIILLALGAVFIALGIKSIIDIPGQEKILETAVYLDEPRVLSENEGKLVIIHGKPEMTAPAYDHELKLTLDTIKAYRYREIYKRTEDTEEKIKWEWVADGQTTFLGKARIGDFDLDESILSAFPTESHYKDFDQEETKYYNLFYESLGSSDLYVLPDGGYYVDDTTLDPYDYSFSASGLYERAWNHEGTTAYRYRHYDPEKNGEHTIVGIQRGSRLVKNEKLGSIVKSGVLSKDQIISSDKTGIIGGAAAFFVIGAALVWFGLRRPRQKTAAKKAA